MAVVEQVDNIWIDRNLHIGSSEAPMHLWIWRPIVSPELPPPASEEDGAARTGFDGLTFSIGRPRA